MQVQMDAQASRRWCIGLDVHREFAQVAIWQDGRVSQAGRFPATPEGVWAFAEGLGPVDEVGVGGDREQLGDRDAVGQSGRAGGGVQPGEDAGDR